MLSFTAIIQKFSSKGEKTGWTYVDIPPDILTGLKLTSKKEFRLKGFIDDVPIKQLAAYPIGEGNYIIALNGPLRKELGKREGAMVKLKISLDASEMPKSPELMACLEDDKEASLQFERLNRSHQNYFHKYVLTAKTLETKTGRVVNIINALHRKQNFGEMIRGLKGVTKTK